MRTLWGQVTTAEELIDGKFDKRGPEITFEAPNVKAAPAPQSRSAKSRPRRLQYLAAPNQDAR